LVTPGGALYDRLGLGIDGRLDGIGMLWLGKLLCIGRLIGMDGGM
jgi:hypothetical protein